jgi:hypothetical protein
LKEVRLIAAVFFEARGKPHEARRISEAEAEITATDDEDFEELYGAWEPTLYAAAMADDRYFALLVGGPRWDDHAARWQRRRARCQQEEVDASGRD